MDVLNLSKITVVCKIFLLGILCSPVIAAAVNCPENMEWQGGKCRCKLNFALYNISGDLVCVSCNCPSGSVSLFACNNAIAHVVVARPDIKCVACPITHFEKSGRCHRCETNCSSKVNEYEEQSCGMTQNRICECNQGYYRDTVSHTCTKRCSPCLTTDPAERVPKGYCLPPENPCVEKETPPTQSTQPTKAGPETPTPTPKTQESTTNSYYKETTTPSTSTTESTVTHVLSTTQTTQTTQEMSSPTDFTTITPFPKTATKESVWNEWRILIGVFVALILVVLIISVGYKLYHRKTSAATIGQTSNEPLLGHATGMTQNTAVYTRRDSQGNFNEAAIVDLSFMNGNNSAGIDQSLPNTLPDNRTSNSNNNTESFEITDQVFDFIANNVTQWRSFGIKLNVGGNLLDQIGVDKRHSLFERNYAVLTEWRKKEIESNQEPQWSDIKEALNNLNKQELIRETEEKFTEQTSST